jgi:hypothetical protein
MQMGFRPHIWSRLSIFNVLRLTQLVSAHLASTSTWSAQAERSSDGTLD